MKPRIVFMFSGQGSQFYQMGRGLFDNNATFRRVMEQLDTVYKTRMGESVVAQIYDDAHSVSAPFSDITFSHPAIFMLEYALIQVFLEKGIKPDMTLGASMGDFASSVAAGILTVEEAFSMLIKQVQVLKALSGTGGMTAVIKNANVYEAEFLLKELSELSAINFDGHFVISGQTENLKKISHRLLQRGITHFELPVNIPFHAAGIDSAKQGFLNSIQAIQLNSAEIPFVSCVTGAIKDDLSVDYFWRMIREPILFQKAVKHAEFYKPLIYIDLGPSGTLATFVKYNLDSASQSQSFAVLSKLAPKQDNIDKIVAAIGAFPGP